MSAKKIGTVFTTIVGLGFAALVFAVVFFLARKYTDITYLPTVTALLTAVGLFYEGWYVTEVEEKEEGGKDKKKVKVKVRKVRDIPAGSVGVIYFAGNILEGYVLKTGNHFLIPGLFRHETVNLKIQAITIPGLKDGAVQPGIIANAYGQDGEEVEFECRLSIEARCEDPVKFMIESTKETLMESAHNTFKGLLRRFMPKYTDEQIVANTTASGADLKKEIARLIRNEIESTGGGGQDIGTRHGWKFNMDTLEITKAERASAELRADIANKTREKAQKNAQATQRASVLENFEAFRLAYIASGLDPKRAAELARIDSLRNAKLPAPTENTISGGGPLAQLGALLGGKAGTPDEEE